MIAEDFSATRNRVWPEMEILVKKYVRLGVKILDVGCGNGRLVEILPEVEYWGVDTSEGLIGEAKEKLRNKEIKKLRAVNFRVLDMLELAKLGEKDFDAVFMFASLNHIAGQENRHKVLEEVRRILKPGGVLIMTNWNMWQVGAGKSLWRYKFQFPRYKIQDTNKFQIQNPKSKINAKSQIRNFGLGFRDVMTVWESVPNGARGKLYYRAFRLGELRGLLGKAGFEVVESYYSLGGERAHWWNGKNVVTVGRFVGE